MEKTAPAKEDSGSARARPIAETVRREQALFGNVLQAPPHKLSEIVAERILQQIITRNWPSGEIIGTEREMMARYSVSRATFREAIRQLERHGVARMRRGAGGGILVSDAPMISTIRAIVTYLTLSDVPLEDQLEVQLILDTTAARLAAERITDAGCVRLRDMAKELRSPALAPNERGPAEIKLRAAISNASGNSIFAPFIHALHAVWLDRLKTASPRSSKAARPPRTTRTAEDLVEAVASRDKARAEDCVRTELLARRSAMSKLVTPATGVWSDTLHMISDDQTTNRKKSKDKRKLGERTAFALARDIRRNAWAEGTNIGSETTLQKRYGVSRAVLREAIRMLELHRIVRTKCGVQGGIIVGRPDPAYTIACALNYLRYLKPRILDLWEIEEALDIYAAEAAAGHITDAQAADLRHLRGRLETCADADIILTGSDVHMFLAQICGNDALPLFLAIVLKYDKLVIPRPRSPKTAAWLREHHLALVDAVLARDPTLARRHMTEIMEWARTAIHKNKTSELRVAGD